MTACGTSRDLRFDIDTLAGFPSDSDEEGIAQGVSACYAGVLDGHLIMAGGCNFPVAGEPKKYYRGIYAAKIGAKDAEYAKEALAWRLIGYLPEGAAYGGAVAMGDSLLFIGGNTASHSLASVVSLRLKDGKTEMHTLPSLPVAADNMAVAADKEHLYVFGGNQDGKPSKTLWIKPLDGKENDFVKVDMPGEARVQPVAAAIAGKVYVWGGFYSNGEASRVATDGYCYDTKTGQWSPLPSPTGKDGQTLTLSGGVAVPLNGRYVLGLGGVNKDIFLDAISGRYQLVAHADYLKQPVSWYRFNPVAVLFDTKQGVWLSPPAVDSRLARAGAQVVEADGHLYYIGGELKPSVRTAEVLRIDEDRRDIQDGQKKQTDISINLCVNLFY